MTFIPVPDKAVDDDFTELMWDTYIKDNLNIGVARPLGHAAFANVANVQFASIPATHEHLIVIGYVIPATTIDTILRCRINGLTGANYYDELISASAATPSSAEGLGQTSWPAGGINGNFSASPIMMWLPSYAAVIGGGLRSFVGLCGYFTNITTGGIKAQLRAGMYYTAAANVSQLDFFAATGNISGRLTLLAIGTT